MLGFLSTVIGGLSYPRVSGGDPSALLFIDFKMLLSPRERG